MLLLMLDRRLYGVGIVAEELLDLIGVAVAVPHLSFLLMMMPWQSSSSTCSHCEELQLLQLLLVVDKCLIFSDQGRQVARINLGVSERVLLVYETCRHHP
jgi:hypothetical protein